MGAQDACTKDWGLCRLNILAVMPDAIHPIGKCMINTDPAADLIIEECDVSSPGAPSMGLGVVCPAAEVLGPQGPLQHLDQGVVGAPRQKRNSSSTLASG